MKHNRTSDTSLVLYRNVGKAQSPCDLGELHPVVRVVRKRVWPADHPDGTPGSYVDTQGRMYVPSEVDGKPVFVRGTSTQFQLTAPKRAVDVVTGRPIAKEQKEDSLLPRDQVIAALAALMIPHEMDFTYDGLKTGCACGHWQDRGPVSAEADHMEHLARELAGYVLEQRAQGFELGLQRRKKQSKG